MSVLPRRDEPVQLAAVRVPVLLGYGAEDALLDPASASVQASYFGSTDVTTLILRNTAHLLMLEPTAPVLRHDVSTWLHIRHR